VQLRAVSLVAALLLSASPAGAEGFKVLVLDFLPEGVRPAIARMATELVAAELANLDGLEVMTRSDLKTIAELEGDKQAAGCDENACLADLAGALGARYVIYGDVLLVKPQYTLTLKRFDAKRAKVDKRVVRVVERRADFPEEVAKIVPAAMKDLAAVTLPSSVALTARPGMKPKESKESKEPKESKPVASKPKEKKTRLEPSPIHDVIGFWRGQGHFFNGRDSKATYYIERTSEHRARVEFNRFGLSRNKSFGLMLDDTLYAAWGSRTTGVTVYERTEGGLVGIFTRNAQAGIGHESAEPKKAGDGFIGTWLVKGVKPDKSSYACELSVKEKKDGFYRAVWTAPDGTKTHGFGIERDGRLVLAYHLSADGLQIIKIEGPGQLSAVFSLGEPGKGGEEKLTRSEPKMVPKPAPRRLR
jgi:hypothetical protein